MRWVDYGLTATRPRVLAERVPPATVFDLAPVLSALTAAGQLAGLEVPDWPQGRVGLEALLQAKSSRCLLGLAGEWRQQTVSKPKLAGDLRYATRCAVNQAA
jgi:hypothetical protein